MPVVQTTEEQPLGPVDPKRNPLCAGFDRGLRSVAVVGNGPITESHRAEIVASDLVIRSLQLR